MEKKWKGLFLSMLAGAALTACSDNDIVENGSEVNGKNEKVEAYLSFSIAAATNSSRATVDEGNNTGDGHEDPETSGHTNVGTAAENNVKEIMVLFYNTTTGYEDQGVCMTYTLNTSTNSFENSGNKQGENETDIEIVKNADDTYSPKSPYRLTTTGNYKVLVILNPCDGAKNITGTTYKERYDNILTGKYDGEITGIIGSGKDAFMMANKAEATIQVTIENSTPGTAAGLSDSPIDVERVASKITFRPTTLSDFTAVGSLGNGNNLYKITAQHWTYTVETAPGWVVNNDGSFSYYATFNKATTNESVVNDRTPIWVLITNGTDGNPPVTEYYTANTGDYTGYLSGQAEPVTALKMTKYTEMEGKKPIYQGTRSEKAVETSYYVRLERYALVNLNKSINYVRHTGTTATDEIGVGNAFNVVSTSRYLLTPNTKALSEITIPTTPWSNETDNYFNKPLYTVEAAISNGTNMEDYFTALPGTINDNSQYGSGEDAVEGNVNPEPNYVGSLLDYCMENSVQADHQNSLYLTTGIIFEAQIYDQTGKAVSVMYKFNDSFYASLKALNDNTNDQFAEYLDDNNIPTEGGAGPLDDGLSKAGVEVYRNGKCYYFSSPIKHYEYGANSTGDHVMENAIMRNNIYSLEVSSVDKFGFASTEIEPGTCTTDKQDDLSVYLTLKARILPWIVRFNNIKF